MPRVQDTSRLLSPDRLNPGWVVDIWGEYPVRRRVHYDMATDVYWCWHNNSKFRLMPSDKPGIDWVLDGLYE